MTDDLDDNQPHATFTPSFYVAVDGTITADWFNCFESFEGDDDPRGTDDILQAHLDRIGELLAQADDELATLVRPLLGGPIVINLTKLR
jgi:hypothetical protein